MMKTSIETIAKLCAVAVWTDGEYDEAEKVVLGEIADALELDNMNLNSLVDTAVAEIERYDDDQVNAYIETTCKDVCPEEKEIVFEVLLEMILADGVITKDEVSNLLAMAENLGISETEATLLIVDMVKSEDYEVEF